MHEQESRRKGWLNSWHRCTDLLRLRHDDAALPSPTVRLQRHNEGELPLLPLLPKENQTSGTRNRSNVEHPKSVSLYLIPFVSATFSIFLFLILLPQPCATVNQFAKTSTKNTRAWMYPLKLFWLFIIRTSLSTLIRYRHVTFWKFGHYIRKLYKEANAVNK